MTRFYPDELPEFEHEPTKDNFSIEAAGGECGEGVMAKIAFDPEDIVFRFTGFYTENITLFSLEVKPLSYIHDPYFMGKVLHRCEPNCSVNMKRREFKAVKPIKAGDWITMDYEQTESKLFRPFYCVCGKPECESFERKLITGFDA